MSDAKQSIVRNETGERIGTNYTEEREDGKVENRHYSPLGVTYLGKTVSDPETGKSEHYNYAGRKTS